MAVATPATATAPRGPERTITSTDSSSELAAAAGGEDEFIMTSPSVQRCGAQFVRLSCRDGFATVSPGRPDIGDYCRDLVVGQPMRTWRHAVGHWISSRPRRIATVEHHPDRINACPPLARPITTARPIM